MDRERKREIERERNREGGREEGKKGEQIERTKVTSGFAG